MKLAGDAGSAKACVFWHLASSRQRPVATSRFLCDGRICVSELSRHSADVMASAWGSTVCNIGMYLAVVRVALRLACPDHFAKLARPGVSCVGLQQVQQHRWAHSLAALMSVACHCGRVERVQHASCCAQCTKQLVVPPCSLCCACMLLGRVWSHVHICWRSLCKEIETDFEWRAKFETGTTGITLLLVCLGPAAGMQQLLLRYGRALSIRTGVLTHY